MNPSAHLKKTFLKEGVNDYVGLWSFFRELEIEFAITRFEDSKKIVLEVLKDFLERNCIHLGFINQQGKFERWGEIGTAAYEKISRELENLNREPNINEICWIETTPIGEWESRKPDII